MTKPQTFEEAWEEDGGNKYSLSMKAAGLAMWNAAHENAARICEQQRIGIDAFGSIDFHVGLTQEMCAEAIREAAKR